MARRLGLAVAAGAVEAVTATLVVLKLAGERSLWLAHMPLCARRLYSSPDGALGTRSWEWRNRYMALTIRRVEVLCRMLEFPESSPTFR